MMRARETWNSLHHLCFIKLWNIDEMHLCFKMAKFTMKHRCTSEIYVLTVDWECFQTKHNINCTRYRPLSSIQHSIFHDWGIITSARNWIKTSFLQNYFCTTHSLVVCSFAAYRYIVPSFWCNSYFCISYKLLKVVCFYIVL